MPIVGGSQGCGKADCLNCSPENRQGTITVTLKDLEQMLIEEITRNNLHNQVDSDVGDIVMLVTL